MPRRSNVVAAIVLAFVATTEAAAQCPRETGWWGYSAVRSMVIDEVGTALLTSGELLLTASVVDPSQPAILGEVRVGDGARVLAVAGGIGWVATAAGELVLVDVHDPSTPRLTGRLAASPRAVAPLAGDVVAMVVGDALWMVDAADAATPRRLATVPLAGTGRALVTLGTLVVAADGQGLVLVDASDPGAPWVVSTLGLEDSGAQLAAAGDRVFVAATRPGRLHVVDVADPAAPRRLHTVAIPPQPGGIAFAEPATVVILSYGEDGDEVLTLEAAGDDPPRLAGRLAPGGQLSALAVFGSTAWVARVVSGASAIETSPPMTPRVVGELTLPAAMVSPTAVGLAGENVLVLGSHPGRLHVVDAGAAPHPVELANLDLPGDAALGLAITGTLALTSFGTCDWGEYGLECVDVGLAVVDVADPTRPTIVSLLGMASSCLSDLIAASESLALVGGAGLQVVDLGDPAPPELVATIGHGARHVALDGRLGVYSTSSEELCILGLDDAAAPVSHGCHSLPGPIEGLALEGATAAVLVSHPYQAPPGDPELVLLDLSDPAAPRELATLETWESRGPIAMDGDTVLVDAGDRWLVVDVAEPAAPQLQGFSRPATTRALALSGAAAAVAFEDGVALYDLSACGASPPLADFGWSPALPALGETVQLVDRSGGPPTGWSWDFGDGSSASGAGPSHAFQGPGPFRVELAAVNDHGASTAVHEVPVYSLGMPTPSSTVIPAAAHLDGLGDTRWRSDLVLATTSVGGTAVDALLFFLPRAGDNTLARGARVAVPTLLRLDDVVAGALAAGDEAGAILIASERPLVVSSRTFTDGPDGSHGQAVPAVRPAEVLAHGEVASLLLLEETTDVRSNVGAVNLTGAPAELELALLDREGRPLGVVRRTLPPFGSLQANQVLLLVSQAPVEQARAEIRVLDPGARIAAYASVVDNATGDPTLIQGW